MTPSRVAGATRRFVWSISLAAATVYAAAAQESSPSWPLIQASETGGQGTLAVLLPGREVLTASWAGTPPPLIRYSDMTGPPGLEQLQPLVLASLRDQLYFLDRGGLFTWNPVEDGPAAKLRLVRAIDLTAPSSMAVAPDGTVFIGDSTTRLIHRVRPGTEIRTIANDVTPTSLSVVGRELQAFDREAGAMYFVVDTNAAVPQPPAGRLPTFDKPSVQESLRTVTAAVNHDGVYYLASPTGVLVQSAGRPQPLRLTQTPVSQVAVTEDHVFAAESDGVRIVRRAVPATFTFDGGRERATLAAISTLEYLAGRDVVIGDAVVTDRDYASTDDLLVAQGILPGSIRAIERFGAQPPATLQARLSQTLCKLAASNCATLPPSKPLAAGTTVVLPPTLRRSIRLAPVDLAGRSVIDHLRTRVPLDEDRSQITAEYLAAVNRASAIELAFMKPELGYALATPARADLRPGVVIYQTPAGESVNNDVQGYCGVDITTTVGRPFSMPQPLTSSEVTAYLPRHQTFTTIAPLPGVDHVEFQFGEATIEQLSADAARRLQEPDVRECLQRHVGQERVHSGSGDDLTTALIVSALRVKKVRYRFIGADGKSVKLSSDLVERRFDGHYHKESRILEYEHPIYVGYRSVAWADVLAGRLDQATWASGNRSSDLLRIRRGRLLLPETVWRLDALVPAIDLRDATSPLRALQRALSVGVAAAGSGVVGPAVRTTAQSSDGRDAPAVVVPTLTDVSSDRTELFKTINYDSGWARGLTIAKKPPLVGIAERERSINFFHQDFMEPFQPTASAWQKVDDNAIGFTPRTTTVVTGPGGGVVRDFARENDHGTHVAGIVGSRSTSPAPGLLPTAQLFLVDTTDPNTFAEKLTAVFARTVNTFNLSTKIENANVKCGDDCLKDTVNAISTTTETAVYVMAAGNESTLLKQAAFPPLEWITRFKENIIGVAATTPEGTEIMPTFTDGHGHHADGSNSGPRFVQLAARGASVFGPVSEQSSYGDASGTSQAVPQVTAAVELLRRSPEGLGLSPARIKARLIYTSRWQPRFEGRVWGGLLDVGRAVHHLNANVFSNHTEADKLFSIVWNSDFVVNVASSPVATVYRPDLDNRQQKRAPSTLRWSRVLRVEWVPDSQTYRVAYLDDDNYLTLLLNVRLVGTVVCTDLGVWDDTTRSFVPSDFYPGCQIPLQQIRDYISATPPVVHFP